MELRTTKKYYRVDRKEISFLKFILEAYDGIAVLTTSDSERGVIELHIPPGCEDVVEIILQDLRNDIIIDEFV